MVKQSPENRVDPGLGSYHPLPKELNKNKKLGFIQSAICNRQTARDVIFGGKKKMHKQILISRRHKNCHKRLMNFATFQVNVFLRFLNLSFL